jgi:hypothetical protein
LTFTDGGVPAAGVFRFDEKLGLLFLDLIDRYDNLYYAHLHASFPASGNSFKDLTWRPVRRPYDKDPLFFKGRFEKNKHTHGLGVVARKHNQPLLWDSALQDGKRNRWGNMSKASEEGIDRSWVFAALKSQSIPTPTGPGNATSGRGSIGGSIGGAGSNMGIGSSRTSVNGAGKADESNVNAEGRSLWVTHPRKLEATHATQKPEETHDYFKLVLERVREEPKWRREAREVAAFVDGSRMEESHGVSPETAM